MACDAIGSCSCRRRKGAKVRSERSTLFDIERLKNGNQMLASEGVVATLFYRWLARGDERSLLARYGDCSMHRGAQQMRPGPDAPLMLQLVTAHRGLFRKRASGC